MPTMTALEAKNAFGQFLDAAQRAPVEVTKNGRVVGAMFSQVDLQAMAAAYLSAPVREGLAAGEVTLSEALLRQAEMIRRLEAAEADVVVGRVQTMDAAFFDRLRDRVREGAAQR